MTLTRSFSLIHIICSYLLREKKIKYYTTIFYTRTQVLIPSLLGTLTDKSNHVNKLSSIQGVAKTIFGVLCERTDEDSAREEVCDLDILPRRRCRWSEWPENVSSLRKDFETEAKRKSGINPNYFHSDTAQTPLEVLCATGDVEAVEWLLHTGAIADIDSEHMRIKLSAAQYCARLYTQNNLDHSEDRDKEKRLQRREISTCLRRHCLLLRTLVARQSKTALTLVKATRYSQSDAEPVCVLCPTVASLRHELYVGLFEHCVRCQSYHLIQFISFDSITSQENFKNSKMNDYSLTCQHSK